MKIARRPGSPKLLILRKNRFNRANPDLIKISGDRKNQAFLFFFFNFVLQWADTSPWLLTLRKKLNL